MLTDTKIPKSPQTANSSEVASPLENHNSPRNTLPVRDDKDKRSKLESKK